MTAGTDAWIAWAAQLACIFEALAEKPGNVTRFKDCANLKFEQFMVSAAAIGPAFQEAASAPVGATILRAVTDTRRLAAVNTNVGILLLLAPLAKAAALGHPGGLREALREVLAGLSVEDARLGFQAIALAAPHGLGQAGCADVRGATVECTLLQAMDMARERDALAREYVTDYAVVFETGLPCLNALWDRGERFSDCVVQTFLTILSCVPDTDIARKTDQETAREISGHAASILAQGGVFSREGREALALFDTRLRDARRRFNPGTTADLVAGVLFAFCITRLGPDQVPQVLARW